MGKGEIAAKNKAMAAYLRDRGIYHGKRLSVGVSNIPSVTDVGSAAYRRLKEAERRKRSGK